MSAISAASATPRFGAGLSSYLRGFLHFDEPSRDAEEEARAGIDFALEMLDRHPDAFASEHDVRAMMLLFPDQF